MITLDRIRLPDVGAGLDAALILDPTGDEWMLMNMLFFTLTTNAVVGNRRAQIRISQTARDSWGYSYGAFQVNTFIIHYLFARGAGRDLVASVDTSRVQATIPTHQLWNARVRIETLIIGLDPGDNLTGFNIEIFRGPLAELLTIA